ncbi:MAG: endonuclease related protein [Methanothermobacter sp.]|nr:endonuclease related protein [Methanothermobacter sp.]BAZ98789.1 Endonuclease III [Methanothermobacter sp. EMTCatA1]
MWIPYNQGFHAGPKCLTVVFIYLLNMKMLRHIYRFLMELYGPQGWWPLLDRDTMTLRYHPGDYTPPSDDGEVFEVITGSILTQNTSWDSAASALRNLAAMDALKPQRILSLDDAELEAAIRCAGFYRQKASYLREMAGFFISLEGSTPSRKELLKVRGVGPETADSVLLYAYRKPEFVVDAYTRRILTHLGLIAGDESYHRIKELFERSIEPDFRVFQEYHALIVRHGKSYYRGRVHGEGDPLTEKLGGSCD